MVSIIIPVYNGERIIQHCLESVLKQTYKDIEAIVVDDGSEDKTSCIVNKMALRDIRIRYLFQSNQGVSAARNLGIKNARGEFLLFLDADDEYLPEAVDILLNEIEQNNADVVIAGIQKIKNTSVVNCVPAFGDAKKKMYMDEELEKLRRWIVERNPKDLPELPCITKSGEERDDAFRLGSPGARLFRTNSIGECCFDISLSQCEDLLFNNNFLKKAKLVVIIDMPVYRYIINDKSASNSVYSINAKNCYLSLAEKYYELKNDFDQEYKSAVEKKIFLCCWAGIKRGIIANSYLKRNDKAKEIKAYMSNEPYRGTLRKIKVNSIIRKKDRIKCILLKLKLRRLVTFL